MNYTFNANLASLDVAANWSPGGIPTAADSATIPSGKVPNAGTCHAGTATLAASPAGTATFEGEVAWTGGSLEGGIFNGPVLVSGNSVYGGTFNGPVNIPGGGAWIYDGVFNGPVTFEGGWIYGGSFHGVVLVGGMVYGGTFTGVVTVTGMLEDGTFSGAVILAGGQIDGGTFTGTVTRQEGGGIWGGEFPGTLILEGPEPFLGHTIPGSIRVAGPLELAVVCADVTLEGGWISGGVYGGYGAGGRIRVLGDAAILNQDASYGGYGGTDLAGCVIENHANLALVRSSPWNGLVTDAASRIVQKNGRAQAVLYGLEIPVQTWGRDQGRSPWLRW